MITVAEIPAGIPEYDRGEWRHWVDEDGDCQDARNQIVTDEGLFQASPETGKER